MRCYTTSEALARAVDLIVEFTEPDERQNVVRLVQKRLDKCLSLSAEQAAWLRAFSVLVPQAGCRRLIETISSYSSPTEVEFGYTLLGKIFGDRHDLGTKPKLTNIAESERATLVADLVDLAYHVAHPTTDIIRNGAYRAGSRDFAQDARSYLFERLAEMKCPETHRAFARFSSSPKFAHMKSRLLEMQTELAASASEPQAMPIEHVIRFDQEGRLTPMNTEMLHETMLNRLSDYEHFLQHSEFSNRKTLRLVEQEAELRKNISNWLNDHSRDMYRVNQESVKVNENRTDIRLSATAVDLESAIELRNL